MLKRSRRQRSRGRRTNGQSLVEFAIAIPLTLSLFLGIFELGRHYYTRLSLRSAVSEAARFAVTGRTLDDPNTGNPLSRAESIQLVVQQKASQFNVDVSQITVSPADGGGPGDVVQVSVQYTYTFWFEPMSQLLSGMENIGVATVMKNEPAF